MRKRRIAIAIGAVLAAGTILSTTVPLAAPGRRIASGKWPIRLDNDVAKCVTIEPRQPVEAHNLLLLPAMLRWVRSTAHCGCMSAVLSYRVGELVAERSFHETVHGELIDMTHRAPGTTVTEFDFVLQADRELERPRPFRLSLGCAAPD